MNEIEKINLFLSQKSRNQWIDGENFSIYVRKGYHIGPNRKIVQTLDIASISSHQPSKGLFTQFIEELERLAPVPIYIESVLEPRFGAFFLRRGYELIPDTKTPCYFLDISV